jgi:hypothetical protein
MRLRVGNRVQVKSSHENHSGKEGYLIAKTAIPMKDNGVPDLPGHHNALSTPEVGVKQDDGTVFIIHMGQLTKLSED